MQQALYTKCGLGLIIALLTVSADQLSKYVILSTLSPFDAIEVTSYFNLVLVFNRGISFGLFSDNQLEIFPWIMAGLTIVISVIAIIWILKTHRILIVIGLGFVIGGALGNGIDRLCSLVSNLDRTPQANDGILLYHFLCHQTTQSQCNKLFIRNVDLV